MIDSIAANRKPDRKSLIWHFIFMIGCYSISMIIVEKGGFPFIFGLLSLFPVGEYFVPSAIGWIGIVFITYSIVKINNFSIQTLLILGTICLAASWGLFTLLSENLLITILFSIPFIFAFTIWAFKLKGTLKKWHFEHSNIKQNV